MIHTIACFGEAEKGDFHKAYFCNNLAQLSQYLGEPPSADSKGLMLAIQALLFQADVIFFRVHEEGFSSHDYFKGLDFLENKKVTPQLSAICLPGVGSYEIIEATTPLCSTYHSFLILTEQDLYDYLTDRPSQK